METAPKSPFRSRTIWAGLVMILAAIAALFGYTISPEDQTQLTDLLMAVVAAVAGFAAIWGRVTATQPIKLPGR